jgi:hypothetical protein
MVAVNATTGCSGLAAPSMGSSWNSPCPDLPWEEGSWCTVGRARRRAAGEVDAVEVPVGHAVEVDAAGSTLEERATIGHCWRRNASRAGHGQASGLLVSAGLRVCAGPPCAEPPLRRRRRKAAAWMRARGIVDPLLPQLEGCRGGEPSRDPSPELGLTPARY